MPLASLLTTAKKHYAQQEKQQMQRLQETVSANTETKVSAPKYIIADSPEYQKQVDWLQCRHLKQTEGKQCCLKFFSLCGKERCDPKYME